MPLLPGYLPGVSSSSGCFSRRSPVFAAQDWCPRQLICGISRTPASLQAAAIFFICARSSVPGAAISGRDVYWKL